eukprot:gene5351-7102_t
MSKSNTSPTHMCARSQGGRMRTFAHTYPMEVHVCMGGCGRVDSVLHKDRQGGHCLV